MARGSKEFRERGVRLATDAMDKHRSRWAAIEAIATKLGCSPQTLHKWVEQTERDEGRRPGLTTDEKKRLKELECENKELKRANTILRQASAYFAQAELDRKHK